MNIERTIDVLEAITFDGNVPCELVDIIYDHGPYEFTTDVIVSKVSVPRQDGSDAPERIEYEASSCGPIDLTDHLTELYPPIMTAEMRMLCYLSILSHEEKWMKDALPEIVAERERG
jgi:hypothetical protein